MHNAHLNLTTPRTRNHHANKRWSSVCVASLAALMLTAVVLGPAVAAPPPPGLKVKKGCELFVTGVNKTKNCYEIADEAADKVKIATMSDSQAYETYRNVRDKCLECRR